MLMERHKTQAEVRKERFDVAAQAAKGITELALREIDQALADDEEVRANLEVGVKYGNLTVDEAEFALRAYRETRGIPIYDDDTLAGPVGYYEPPESIY